MRMEAIARYRLSFFKKLPYRKWRQRLMYERHWQSVGTRRFAFRHTLFAKFKYKNNHPFASRRQSALAMERMKYPPKKVKQ